jgi:EAL domain-containing protein (putative c-di-GMP-specific phosphodiesterase class I)
MKRQWAGEVQSTMDMAARIEQLKVERARFLAFAFARSDLLIEMDRKGVITFASGAAHSLVDQEPADLVGRSIDILFAPPSKGLTAKLVEAVKSGTWVKEQAVSLASGRRIVQATLAACPLPSKPENYFVTFALDATPPAQVAAPAVTAGTPPVVRDQQTGLADSASFTELARRRLADAKPGADLKMTMVELDGLEELEGRTADHGAGLMKDVGKLLSDIGGSNDMATRIAPSKFSVMHDAKVDVTKIQSRIADLARSADPTGAGVKVKTAEVKLDPKGLSDVDMGRALAYAVTKFAQSHAEDFTIDSLNSGLSDLMAEAVQSIGTFRQTISSDGYDLVFQPIVDLRTSKIHHQEALSRLPDGSSPFGMVSFAEEVGFIADFDLSVLRKGLKYLHDYPQAFDIAINVSGRSLQSPAFVDEFLRVINDSGQLGQRLIVEITESSRIQQLDVIDKIVAKLRANKNKVYIDDFGSGAAAFHYLRELHVDVVKIDGSYIRDIEKNARDRAFVRSIISLCIELGLGTVAEFVETPGQVKILTALGMEFGQGYLFGKPNKEIHQRGGKVTTPQPQTKVQTKTVRPATWV